MIRTPGWIRMLRALCQRALGRRPRRFEHALAEALERNEPVTFRAETLVRALSARAATPHVNPIADESARTPLAHP